MQTVWTISMMDSHIGIISGSQHKVTHLEMVVMAGERLQQEEEGLHQDEEGLPHDEQISRQDEEYLPQNEVISQKDEEVLQQDKEDPVSDKPFNMMYQFALNSAPTRVKLLEMHVRPCHDNKRLREAPRQDQQLLVGTSFHIRLEM